MPDVRRQAGPVTPDKTLAHAIAELHPSFSRSSAMRKLLEAFEATLRASSMRFAP